MSPQNHRAAVAGRWWHAPILPRLAKNVYGGTRTRRFEEFGAWQRTKFEAQLNINWKIGRRLGVRGYGSRIQVISAKPSQPLSPEKRCILMKQKSFATTGFELIAKRTRKREFIDEMNF